MSHKINNTRKIKNTKTAEERRAQAEELQASIADQVDQLRNSAQWIRFLQFARSFHPYSLKQLDLDHGPASERDLGCRDPAVAVQRSPGS